MRTPWWQSMRWRLALGSLFVALLATILLTLTVIFAIAYYYGVSQRARLINIAEDNAQRIGMDYTQNGSIVKAAADTLPNRLIQNSQSEEYLLVILNTHSQPVYPRVGARLGNERNVILAFFQAMADPSLQRSDVVRLQSAVRDAQHGVTTVSEFGSGSPISTPRPFVVEPIWEGGQNDTFVVGVLVITPRSAAENTVPPFIATVRQSVFIAAIVVAVLAALAAILFSRTITRPLAKLTNTARVLASGDYSARVNVDTGGELGELATTFNEMATKLEHDVDELRKQELWRRELLMNITHDLATPLTAIAGLGESLVDGVNRNREDYEATGKIIVRETLRLRRLVKDLHMMARMEAGTMQPQRKPVRLATLVDEVLAVLTPEFERANVEPRNVISYSLPTVQADPDMLMRVFSNLCDNAIRHTPAGGVVVIDAAQRGDVLEVAVTDSGQGIPTGALPRVFERFYRADISRQVATGGSGLGLAIVRAIVEAHGGSVRAENAPQAGARILFTLPLEVSVVDATTRKLH